MRKYSKDIEIYSLRIFPTIAHTPEVISLPSQSLAFRPFHGIMPHTHYFSLTMEWNHIIHMILKTGWNPLDYIWLLSILTYILSKGNIVFHSMWYFTCDFSLCIITYNLQSILMFITSCPKKIWLNIFVLILIKKSRIIFHISTLH